jgi:hypothetical protein
VGEHRGSLHEARPRQQLRGAAAAHELPLWVIQNQFCAIIVNSSFSQGHFTTMSQFSHKITVNSLML